MLAASGEVNVRAGDQVLYRSSHKAFACMGLRCHPGSNVHCDTAHIVFANLNLTGVKSRTDFDSKWSHRGDK